MTDLVRHTDASAVNHTYNTTPHPLIRAWPMASAPALWITLITLPPPPPQGLAHGECPGPVDHTYHTTPPPPQGLAHGEYRLMPLWITLITLNPSPSGPGPWRVPADAPVDHTYHTTPPPPQGLAHGEYRLMPLWIWIYCIFFWFVQDAFKVSANMNRVPCCITCR